MRTSPNQLDFCPAPIAIFCYRRAGHLRRTLESLIRCDGFKESQIYVFGDGPRNKTEEKSVEATRRVARELLGPNASYLFFDENRGLSKSVIFGVNYVLERFENIIVIEDDLLLDVFFLKFVNEALQKYSDNEDVLQVSGYMFNSARVDHRGEAMFLPFITSWGWGTWRRAWAVFDVDAGGWEQLGTDPMLRRRFNLGGAYDYASMLESQMRGKIDSWAVRWNWSVFNKNGLVLYPPVSLVQNTGFDGSGTHGRGPFRRLDANLERLPTDYPKFPSKVELNTTLFEQVSKAVWWQSGGWRARCLAILRRLISRIYPSR